MTLMNIRRDGTYSESFKVLEKGGKIRIAEETGQWGVSGNVFFTITTGRGEDGKVIAEVDQSDAYYYDAYLIDYANDGENSIRHILTGDVFVSRRVGDDFAFPGILPTK
ncbi:hypothetical protein ACV22X_05370 [Burkholderia orbicola]|uniref:Uncharacterized protein n=1 Tax=Burkholderia cenocepacia TaxID=95486 RepID=A0AAW4TFU2_9BURK|nr:hypothetical protein [Burkholderia cenocepacia]MCA8380666.1 hypothetical protein [Burkholderia cenocepacia]